MRILAKHAAFAAISLLCTASIATNAIAAPIDDGTYAATADTPAYEATSAQLVTFKLPSTTPGAVGFLNGTWHLENESRVAVSEIDCSEYGFTCDQFKVTLPVRPSAPAFDSGWIVPGQSPVSLPELEDNEELLGQVHVRESSTERESSTPIKYKQWQWNTAVSTPVGGGIDAAGSLVNPQAFDTVNTHDSMSTEWHVLVAEEGSSANSTAGKNVAKGNEDATKSYRVSMDAIYSSDIPEGSYEFRTSFDSPSVLGMSRNTNASVKFEIKKPEPRVTVVPLTDPESITANPRFEDSVVTWKIKDSKDKTVVEGTGTTVPSAMLKALPTGDFTVEVVENQFGLEAHTSTDFTVVADSTSSSRLSVPPTTDTFTDDENDDPEVIREWHIVIGTADSARGQSPFVGDKIWYTAGMSGFGPPLDAKVDLYYNNVDSVEEMTCTKPIWTSALTDLDNLEFPETTAFTAEAEGVYSFVRRDYLYGEFEGRTECGDPDATLIVSPNPGVKNREKTLAETGVEGIGLLVGSTTLLVAGITAVIVRRRKA